MTFPLNYPAFRDWAVPQAVDLQQFPALAAARARSCDLLRQLRTALESVATDWPEVATIAVSGSLGRLEAGPHSDADLIVVLHSNISSTLERQNHLMSHLWKVLDTIGLPRPKPTGVFATPVSTSDLSSRATLGQVNED